jgi:mono/diheme cytochrome c family protein
MKGWKMRTILAILCAGAFLCVTNARADVGEQLPVKPGFDMKMVKRGQYLVKISGCNDCHTPGYAPSEGKVADELWLSGDAFGWRGPWGTTYASNLRILIGQLTEEQWESMAKALKTRPPMPWFNLNAMTKDDLGAMYQFIRYLGPTGSPVPLYVPPDKEPNGPHAIFPSPPK